MNRVQVPPDRIQTKCCRDEPPGRPRPGDVYILDLDFFLMTCGVCGEIAEWEKVPDD